MALYENGGITKMAQTNATNAQKAKAYDDMVAARRDQDAYNLGAQDGEQIGAQKEIERQLSAPRHGLTTLYPSDAAISSFIEKGHQLREFLGLPSQRSQAPSFDEREQIQRDIEDFIK